MTDSAGKRLARSRTASEQVSAALLNAAEAVLDRAGAHEVTIRAVAREANVAPMGVYNRFGNKEGLRVALAARALDELADAIDVPAGPESPDPQRRFRLACRGYRGFALGHPARYSLIFASGSPLQVTTSAVAAHGRAAFGTLIELVRGLAVAEEDSTEVAQAVWCAVHGAVTIEQAGIGQTPDADASYEILLDLLIEGIAASRRP